MRVVFAGTPDGAVPTLTELVRRGVTISAVVTRPDALLGRKRIRTPSPVAAAAARFGIPTITATTLDESVADEIRSLEPDLGVIVAYGGIVREPLLSIPTHGWINLHFSLLPRWRGAAPVQRALIAGDTTIGATVFQLNSGIDEGAIYATHAVSIDHHNSAGELVKKIAQEGAPLVASVVDSLEAGTAAGQPQSGEPSHAPKLTIDDARLDWTKSAHAVFNRFRGVTPEPGAFTMGGGGRLIILEAEIAHGANEIPPGQIIETDGSVLVGTATDPIRLLIVHPAGRRAMPAIEWWRGRGSTMDRLE